MRTVRLGAFASAMALVFGSIALTSSAAFAQGEGDVTKGEEQLSPLPNVADLERTAKFMHITVEKCKMTAQAYADSPTPELVASIPDLVLHGLNAQAFACMRLGGLGARYGYAIKTTVDVAYAVHAMKTATDTFKIAEEQKQKDAMADTLKIVSDIASDSKKREQGYVFLYNDLVWRFNKLLDAFDKTHDIAEQLVGEAESCERDLDSASSAPVFPSIVEINPPVRPQPLSCTASTYSYPTPPALQSSMFTTFPAMSTTYLDCH